MFATDYLEFVKMKAAKTAKVAPETIGPEVFVGAVDGPWLEHHCSKAFVDMISKSFLAYDRKQRDLADKRAFNDLPIDVKSASEVLREIERRQ
jgi:hypothetical protein